MSDHLYDLPAPVTAGSAPGPPVTSRRPTGAWAAARAVLGAALGLVPQLLHHVGLWRGPPC